MLQVLYNLLTQIFCIINVKWFLNSDSGARYEDFDERMKKAEDAQNKGLMIQQNLIGHGYAGTIWSCLRLRCCTDRQRLSLAYLYG
jgi:hypothetical protein